MNARLAKKLRRAVSPARSQTREFKRIDDPELAIEVACRNEKNSRAAIRQGLPTIGAKLTNQYSLEFVVDGHVHLPTVESLQRWREGDSQNPVDLYPSIIPQNLSNRFMEFLAAVDRCTTKGS